MNPGRARNLSDDERVLWNLVARTATPLRGRKAAAEAAARETAPACAVPSVEESVQSTSAAQPTPPKRQHVGHVLDRPTLDKLSKGRLPIEGRVDLHGMSQAEAHSLLLSFLQRAHAGGIRYVLVITGKGSSSGGDGVLKRAVPAWLGTPPFRSLVSSHDHAARNHGGTGALYIRLRRVSQP